MNLQPIIDQIESMNTSDLINLNNLYCQENSYDSEVYDNDEEFFENYLPNSHDAVQKAFYGDYNYSHDYVKFDGYANLESFNSFDATDLPNSLETIAEYCYDNQRTFDMFDYDECEEEEEEEEEENTTEQI